MITEEGARCLEMQSVDGPDVRVVLAVYFLAVAIIDTRNPKLQHLRIGARDINGHRNESSDGSKIGPGT